MRRTTPWIKNKGLFVHSIELYDIWENSKNRGKEAREVAKEQFCNRIFQKFKDGWIPCEDKTFIKWLNGTVERNIKLIPEFNSGSLKGIRREAIEKANKNLYKFESRSEIPEFTGAYAIFCNKQISENILKYNESKNIQMKDSGLWLWYNGKAGRTNDSKGGLSGIKERITKHLFVKSGHTGPGMMKPNIIEGESIPSSICLYEDEWEEYEFYISLVQTPPEDAESIELEFKEMFGKPPLNNYN